MFSCCLVLAVHCTEPKGFNISKTCAHPIDRSHSGVQLVHPQPGFGKPYEVFCDQEYQGGGWIVIQNRFDGSVYFHRGWKQYEDGFGDINGEFWLGLKKIHELTYSNRYELHVVMEDWEGNKAVAKYDRFLVSEPELQYTLESVGTFSGTGGDGLTNHVGHKFSTRDRDHSGQNDGVRYRGAWWYLPGHYSNLNAVYMKGTVPDYANMMAWYHFKGHYYGLKRSRMMIRTSNFFDQQHVEQF